MATARKRRTPAKKKRLTIKEVDALVKQVGELQLRLEKYNTLSIGIHEDGKVEPMKNYTIFLLEEGAKNCLGIAEQLKKGVVISPSSEIVQQQPAPEVEEEIIKEPNSTE